MGARGFVIFKASLRRPESEIATSRSCRALGQGQFGCIFQLFHDEAGTDICQFNKRNKTLIKIIIGLHVADAGFDQIVLMTRSAIGRLYLRQAANDLRELICQSLLWLRTEIDTKTVRPSPIFCASRSATRAFKRPLSCRRLTRRQTALRDRWTASDNSSKDCAELRCICCNIARS